MTSLSVLLAEDPGVDMNNATYVATWDDLKEII